MMHDASTTWSLTEAKAGEEQRFLGTLRIADADLLARVRAATDDGGAWIDRVRAAIAAMLEYPRAHPAYARIVYVEAFRSGARARARLEDDVDALVELIDAGRAELDDPGALTRATAEGLAGAVYGLISMCLSRGGEEAELAALRPQLMFALVRPYLGLDAALAEFDRGGGAAGSEDNNVHR
jgi:AcrR family transcriptional regulator